MKKEKNVKMEEKRCNICPISENVDWTGKEFIQDVQVVEDFLPKCMNKPVEVKEELL